MGEHKTNLSALRNADTSGRPTCRTCPYWLRESATHGFCHAEPPTFFIINASPRVMGQPPQMNPSSHFPPVAPDAWCGRHPQFHAWVESREGQTGCLI